jgi:uncharacterized protein YggE
MSIKMKGAFVLAVVLLGRPALYAQQPPDADGPPVVVTSGEAVVKRAPDRAWVTVAAESRAKTPQQAQQQNAAVMSNVMEKLKGAGITGEAIRTTAIDLQPEFDYRDGKQTLREYVARNSLEVRVDELPKLGEVIDMAVASGAARIGGVRFDLRDRDEAEREALRLAVADARQRATAAAAGAGMQVDRIVRIEEHRETSGPPRPVVMAMRAEMAQAEPTPVAPGELEIRATVRLTAAIK